MKFLIALGTLALGVTATPPNPGAIIPSSAASPSTLPTKAPTTTVPTAVLKRDVDPPIVSVNSAGQLRQGSRVHQPEDWVRSWGSLYVPDMFDYNFDGLDDGSPEAKALRELMHKYPDIVYEDDQNIFEGPGKSQQGAKPTVKPAAKPTAKPSFIKSVKRRDIQATGAPSGKYWFIRMAIFLEETY